LIGIGSLVAAGCGSPEVVEKIVRETVIVEKPVEKIVEKPVEVTKVVEKQIVQTTVVEKEVLKVVVATAQPGYVLQAPEPDPRLGGEVRTAWGITMSSFDIWSGGSGNVLTQMYNNLVRKNPTDGLRTIIPDLATNWRISEDGMKYIFTTREGVKFHDGTPFGPDDVVATYSRVINPPANVPMPAKTLYDAIGKVEKTGPNEVTFTLAKARVWQFDMFSDPGSVIYSKKHLDANSQDLRKVISPGTGPFKFDSEKPAEFFKFKRNAEYWNPKLPYVEFATMLHVPAWTDRGTAVLTGVADFSWNVSFDTFEEGKKRSDIVKVNPINNFGFLEVRWNNKKPPFNDPRVRKAMHLAFNRHIATEVYREEFLNVSRWVSAGGAGATPIEEIVKMPGYRRDNAEDIKEARRLLAEAGFPDGKGLPTFDFVAASVPGHSQVLAPFFVEQMKTNLGMNFKIRVVERALVNEEYKKDFDFVLGTVFHSPSPNHTPMWEAVWKTNGSQNFAYYSNPEFDKVVDALSKETDPDKRRELFAKGQSLLDADPPEVHFGFTSHMLMWRNKVKGLGLDGRLHQEWGRYDTVWVEK
jgi:peptide/nickel transport system substrate-binding protein